MPIEQMELNWDTHSLHTPGRLLCARCLGSDRFQSKLFRIRLEVISDLHGRL